MKNDDERPVSALKFLTESLVCWKKAEILQ